MTTRISLILLLLFALIPGAQTRASDDPQPTPDSKQVFLPLVQSAGQNPNEPAPSVPGQFVVTWKPGTNTETRAANLQSEGGQLVDQIEPLNIDVIDVSEMKTADPNAVQGLLDSYKNNPDVESVEPNYVYTTMETPNDPDQGRQWAWGRVQAYTAWDVTRGSPNVVIAIIDTGIQRNHPDLDAKIVPGYDFVDNDSEADDGNGHGTHVAGTASAETNNATGGAGFCPECRLMPVRALNNGGSGSLANIARAITYAADNGAKVINLSLGGAGSSTLQRAIDYAWNKGVFVACAAGNSNRSTPSYPAGYSNCFAVASTTSTDARSSFSNYGTWVEAAAPGSSIYSTLPTNRYGNLSGTSMATPHVAGLAGLLSSQGLTNAQIRDRICSTSDQISGTGSFWTCGRINADRAVRGTAGNPPPVPTTAPNPTAAPAPSPTAAPAPNPSPTSVPAPNPTPVPDLCITHK